MEENSILQIPEITPFQFSEKESDYGNTVNLFRGDVNFFVPLVSLVGRNGLDVHISALYRGNISRQVRAQNQESPTSILGLGWYLPIDYIEVDTRQTATDEDNRYYFIKWF